nr:oligopeptide/dipeptide ABC transporter ATP-binding protein [Dysosmobacter acutus]
MLEAVGLKKYFQTPGGLLHAVDNVSFQLEKGKTLGVVGESGCGKSTLGRLLLHLLPATEGRILYEGRDVTSPAPAELHDLRRKMQMIFQDPYSSLNPRMTVGQTIGEPLKIYRVPGEQLTQVERLMETVGLARRFYNAYPHELDGGRRQRIGIARALALNPQFVVCDEPVSALDVSIQAQILNLMQDLQAERELTYVFITHDLSVVKHISDDIVVMYLGQIVERCPTKELFKTQLHPYTKALLSAIPRASIHKKSERILLKGEISSPINPGKKCRFAARCNYATEECFDKEPRTEEITPGHFVACHHCRRINGLPCGCR